MFAASVFCVFSEQDAHYTPKERPKFNQKLWDPTKEGLEGPRNANLRWVIVDKNSPKAEVVEPQKTGNDPIVMA
uniref:Uncharacterized protein n=1 Tax=Caenorhabditis japonica TaxID=281687 RepID=A0A8R1ISF7_CAEJA